MSAATDKPGRSPIAANLRAARLAAGFQSISDAARHIGIPVPTAVAHEGSGSSFRKPKLEQLRRYATAYNTTIDALEGGTIVTPPAPKKVREEIARQLVSIALSGQLEGQQIAIAAPDKYKLGDTITISGKISGILRKL